MDTQQYDIILIGASPVMCLHAASLARHHKVLLVDRRDSVGGVWQSGDFDGHTFSCMVPHILEPHPGLYDFLESHLGLEMEDVLEASCVAFTEELFGQKLHPYSSYYLHRVSSPELFAKVKQGTQQGMNYQMFVENVNINNPMLAPHYRPNDNSAIGVKFMKGGTSTFRKALSDKLAQSGCDVLLEKNVDNMKILSDCVTLELNDGNSISAKQVYLAQHCIPDKVTIGHLQPFEFIKTTQHHNSTLQLKVKASFCHRFFYAYFPISTSIYIVSRMDYYVDEVEPGIVYLAITLKGHTSHLSPEFLGSLVQQLVIVGLMSEDAQIVTHQYIEEVRSRIGMEDMVNLGHISNGKVRVVDMTQTGGLGRAIYDNMISFV
jgi:protoporphyrinogen oxidase